MIKVRILPPPGWKAKKLDERYWLELPDGATLADALAAIKMPKLVAKAFFVSINGALARPGDELLDGDSVAFFPIVTGG
ncbi:MAG: MoaD/ThiS family protein [Coriobacteriia bacterium]|nr:MoaD/ThiS family protein [Coriobacteriia bacterium]